MWKSRALWIRVIFGTLVVSCGLSLCLNVFLSDREAAVSAKYSSKAETEEDLREQLRFAKSFNTQSLGRLAELESALADAQKAMKNDQHEMAELQRDISRMQTLYEQAAQADRNTKLEQVRKEQEHQHLEELKKERLEHVQANIAASEAAENTNLGAVAQARLAANNATENYFKTVWKPGTESIVVSTLKVQIGGLQRRHGYDSEWDFSGEAYIEYYTGYNIYASQLNTRNSKQLKFSAVLTESESQPTIELTLQ